jgi:hypothetical protein
MRSGMKKGIKRGIERGIWLAAAACALSATGLCGQSSPGTRQAPEAGRAAAQAVREIDDPPVGRRWLLERDPLRPSGPGRLVAVAAGASPLAAEAAAALPVVHAGERVIVEWNTPVIDARLEAVALNPAPVGAALSVRLVIGGHVVRARALGPGRAELLAGDGRP